MAELIKGEKGWTLEACAVPVGGSNIDHKDCLESLKETRSTAKGGKKGGPEIEGAPEQNNCCMIF